MHAEYAACAEVKPAEISADALTDGKPPPISPFVARCEEHIDAEAIGVCKDCRRRTCEPCSVEVRRLGTFCTHCALVRAGIRR
jgi:hypothetical protein